MTNPWYVYDGIAEPHQAQLPDPPAWRTFVGKAPTTADGAQAAAPGALADADPYWNRARAYRTPASILDAVNAALLLRRPLLVTGKPGTGKSSLAYRVAYELGLGPVLVWPVNSRSTLKEGLYDYDAIARMQDRQFDNGGGGAEDIGRYITLRALGTALLPQSRPRALLIDELDKADPDLPNDLLNVFEEGWFDIPELQRHTQTEVRVRVTHPIDSEDRTPNVSVRNGRVQCREFPFIVLTSNGEREFPPAFLRRCIRVELPDPDEGQLTAIVRAHLGEALAINASEQIAAFAKTNDASTATDQLLNALYIVHHLNGADDPGAGARMTALLTRSLV